MTSHPIGPILFPAARIRGRIATLARRIAADHPGGDLEVVGILRGSFMFLADLARALHRRGARVGIDFVALESYGSGTESSGSVRCTRDLSIDVRGRRVLLVDDILDTGRTLSFAAGMVAGRGAASVRTCVLLDKPARRVVPFHADYVGFTVDDIFVVGYGLDIDHRCRELPFIASVGPS
jgi:hypoxanthine phosphoribosyltransferase